MSGELVQQLFDDEHALYCDVPDSPISLQHRIAIAQYFPALRDLCDATYGKDQFGLKEICQCFKECEVFATTLNNQGLKFDTSDIVNTFVIKNRIFNSKDFQNVLNFEATIADKILVDTDEKFPLHLDRLSDFTAPFINSTLKTMIKRLRKSETDEPSVSIVAEALHESRTAGETRVSQPMKIINQLFDWTKDDKLLRVPNIDRRNSPCKNKIERVIDAVRYRSYVCALLRDEFAHPDKALFLQFKATIFH